MNRAYLVRELVLSRYSQQLLEITLPKADGDRADMATSERSDGSCVGLTADEPKALQATRRGKVTTYQLMKLER